MYAANGIRLPTVRSAGELASLVNEIGFLPAFHKNIPGFSAEECVAPEYWFPDSGEGFWEWKGPVIQQSGCAYAKLLHGCAAFVRLDWYAELANYRRDGYDFDARWDEGLVRHSYKLVYDILARRGSMLSRELRALASAYSEVKRFEEIMVRLQMQGYVVISNFEYQISKTGAAYGWGVARYETPEHRFGAAFTDRVYAHRPEESKRILLDRLRELLPRTDEKELLRLIG